MTKKPDYKKHNYCRICEEVFPKTVTRCRSCKRTLRKSQKKHRNLNDLHRI